MPATKYRTAKTGLAVVAFFMLFAGEAVRNLLGWEIFLGIGAAITLVYLVILFRSRQQISRRTIPFWLAFFVLWAVASVLWAYSPADTGLTLWPFIEITLVGYTMAITLPWADILRALGTTLRWVLGISLLFELWVSTFVGHAFYPVWVDISGEKVPAVYQWSRNLLFEGGPIQGIVGNRNQLGFIAVLALIIFSVQLVDRTIWRSWGMVWIGLALFTLAVTRSATDLLAILAVLIVAAFGLWARRVGQRRRIPIYLTAAGLLAAGIVFVTLAQSTLLSLLGKSEDLTGRTDTWTAVTELAQQRPVMGWGWLSPWVPWLEPFNNLAVHNGVHYLQAHNAWLDVWLQVGIIGLIALALVMLSLMWRSWFIAVDQPRWDLDTHRPYTAHSLTPLLITVALLTQSVAESQLVVQSGWALLVIFSVVALSPSRIMRPAG